MNQSFARIVLVAAFACLAAAALAKPQPTATPPPPDPAVLRQGGDTFADAVLIPEEPFWTTGTTTGYTHDYDEACPYSGSESPDVVYRFSPRHWTVVDIDLHGSFYDTKVYVYGAGMELIACNDDYYADYTSRIENLELVPWEKYFIVIDGYGGSHGEYSFSLATIPPPGGDLECPDGSPLEGEPPLYDGYVDAYNGGCTSSEQGVNIMDLEGWLPLCCTSGWFEGGRDHDWFRGFPLDDYNSLEIWAMAEHATWLVAYTGADCDQLEMVASVMVEPDIESHLYIPGDPNDEIWIDIYPDQAVAPPGFQGQEYDYQIVQEFPVGGLPVATENHSWSSVKALFH